MMEKSFDERCAAFDENYPRVLEQIAQAAVQAGRRPEEVTLLAATKTVPLEVVNHAISRGSLASGENRVQELLENMMAWTGPTATCSSSASCRPTRSSI